MKFYSKRGNLINISSSKIINEIFYNLEKYSKKEIKSKYTFILQEDKILLTYSEKELLCLPIDIVPNAKRKRLQYNFKNFEDMYNYIKKENRIAPLFPYIGEDLK